MMKKFLNFKTIGIALFCLFLLSRCGISASTYVHPTQSIGSIIPYITLIAGIAGYFWLGKQVKKRREYDFRNRTDGGVVKYASFAESQKAERKAGFIAFGYLIVALVIAGSVVGIVLVRFSSHYS